MPTSDSSKLSQEQVEQYRECGYCAPIRVLNAAEAGESRSRFEDYLAQNQQRLQGILPRERRVVFAATHLFLNWVYRIASHPRVLDAVESVLGPDLLVWESAWFFKFPRDKAFVSWHQDGTYWALRPLNVSTAWIALAESDRENGCLRVVPGTHKSSFFAQRETYGQDNMLSRGQEIAVEVDERQAVDLILKPGEMSLHHVAIVHGSKANVSDRPRIGLAVRYITPDVVQDAPERQMVQLVRGQDKYGHYEIVEPPQEGAVRPEIQAEALRRVLRNVLPEDSSQSKDGKK